MRFVLSGVETNNKGAELMLYAILQEIERRHPNSSVYFDMGSIRQGLGYIQTSLKLKEKPIERIHNWNKHFHFIGLALRLKVPPIYFEDIYGRPGTSYFIDASGFHFSDQWKWPKILMERKKRLWAANVRKGAKLVFLPQAFGPFNENYSRNYLSVMSKYADVIMPREELSFNYLVNSGLVNTNKIMQYPDFTSLVEGVVPEKYNHLKGGVCIIPNARMIDKGLLSIDKYISFLSSIVELAQNKGYLVYLLNHEGKDDEKLAYKCSSVLKNRIEIVSGLNALEVKGMISTAYLVVTSRFHGAVSALNTCVPCLATSWSHKYSELFKEYRVFDGILSLENKDKSLNTILLYLDAEKNEEVRNHLYDFVSSFKHKTREMWDYIWNM